MPARKVPQGFLRFFRPFESICNAFSFFTILKVPCGRFSGEKALASVSLAGLFIGGGLALVHSFTGGVSAFLMVLYLAVITGFLHLDGLADTFDALFSHRDREGMLAIMKDSRVGPMGAAAIALCFLGKFQAFILIDNVWFLVAIPALARFGMVIAASVLPYARQDGLGKDFVRRMGIAGYIQIIPVQCILFLCGLEAWLLVNAVFIAVLFLLVRWYKAKIGGVTGDMLGAVSEIMEVALFLTAAFFAV